MSKRQNRVITLGGLCSGDRRVLTIIASNRVERSNISGQADKHPGKIKDKGHRQD